MTDRPDFEPGWTQIRCLKCDMDAIVRDENVELALARHEQEFHATERDS